MPVSYRSLTMVDGLGSPNFDWARAPLWGLGSSLGLGLLSGALARAPHGLGLGLLSGARAPVWGSGFIGSHAPRGNGLLWGLSSLGARSPIWERAPKGASSFEAQAPLGEQVFWL